MSADAWDRIKGSLAARLSEGAYQNWISRTAFSSLRDGELTGRIYIVSEVLVSAGLLFALAGKMFWIFLPLETRLGRSRTDLEAQMTRLRASEARQRMVLGEMPALVWTTDRQFLLTSIGGG